jgi:predicted MPP superfamily phosphohydrolase
MVVQWGSFIEPQMIQVKKVDIDLKSTPRHETIKIALISDFHVGKYKKNLFVKRVVSKIIEQKPDLVLIAGDFLMGKGSNAQYLYPLKNLTEQIPVLAVTGNHEFNIGKPNDLHYDDRSGLLRKLFTDWNIPILDNATNKIITNQGGLNITGLPDIWTGKVDFAATEINLDPRLPKILLVHNPDIVLNEHASDFDLVLSAHTHAGQIRLPFIGGLPPLPTKLGRAFDQGLFQLKNNFLYITGGLGETGPRARLFNPPEIVIINLDL